MNSNGRKGWVRIAALVIQILTIVIGLVGGLGGAIAYSKLSVLDTLVEPIPIVDEGVIRTQSYQVPIYKNQGGSKLTFETGAELEMQSGSVFDIQSGTTSGFGGNVTVAGNITTTGDVVVGSGARYPLEYATANEVAYVGITAAFTGTTSVLSTTHGATTSVDMVICTMTAPDEDAGDAYFCVGSVSDGDVTLTALDDDGGTATEVDTTAYYIIIGN